MVIALFLGALLALDVLAYFFGVDSRRTIDDEFRRQAFVDATQYGLR
jgi:hypothetical protein